MGKRTETLLIENVAVDKATRVFDNLISRFPKLQKAIKNTNARLGKFNAAWGGSLNKMKKAGKAMKGVGQSMLRTVTLPIVAAGAASLKMFADFDQGFRGVQTLLDETSFGTRSLSAGVEIMQRKFLNLAKTTPQSMAALTDSLFDAISAEVKAVDAIDFLSAANKLAVGGLTDISIATDGMTSAMGAYKKTAGTATEVAAKFFTAQKFGKTTVEQLAGGLGLVAGLGKQTGVSFDELLASVSAATLGGIRTKAAYTGLKAALANVIKPTQEAKAVAKGLGVEFNQQALEAKGLRKFLDDIRIASIKMEVKPKRAFFALFGSIEAVNFISTLTGSQFEKFGKIIEELGDKTKSVATFLKAFEIQNASLTNRMKILWSQIRDVAIVIGKFLEPVVISIIDKVSRLFGVFKRNPVLLKTTVIIAGLVAVIAPLIIGLGSLLVILPFIITGFAAVTISGSLIFLSILAIAAAIGGLIAAAVFLSDAFGDLDTFFIELWATIKEVFADGITFILNQLKKIPGVSKIASFLSKANTNVGGFGSSIEAGKRERNKETISGTNTGQNFRSDVVVTLPNIPKGAKVQSTSDDPNFTLNLGHSGSF